MALSMALVLTGCGNESGLSTTQGVVTLDGKPLHQASVAFIPEDSGEAAYSVTNSDGYFDLETHLQKGIEPGNYRVLVTLIPPIADKNPNIKTPKSDVSVPAIYASAKTTPLRFSVPHKGPLQIDLQSK